jgi:hypothetical protein
MIMGGGNPATPTTELIDLSAPSPHWVFGPPMSQARIEMNATILPSGKVVALGGSVNDENDSTASFNTDIYDPGTNTFTTGAPNVFPRLYHSNALLLPDATVLVTGSNPARGTYEQHSEIYSPGYLFNLDGTPATRPSISSVTPASMVYGGAFQVNTPDAAGISSVVLMRPGAPTHSFDMEQRLVGLSFTAGSGVLNVTAPPNGAIAPPGYYMLFLLNSAGVPSVAQFVHLSSSPDFSLSASPSSQSVLPGGSTSYNVTVIPDQTFTGTVVFNVSGLPQGATATFTPGSVPVSGTTTMNVSTSLLTPIGSYQLTISGSSGGITHTVTVTLAVGKVFFHGRHAS